MKCIFENDESKKIITVRVSGDMYVYESASLGAEVRARAKKDHYKVLFDFRKAKNHITVLDAYYWITKYYDSVDPHLKWVPVAHLTNAEDETFFSFVETTFINRGAMVRLFKDEEKAIEWLESHRPL